MERAGYLPNFRTTYKSELDKSLNMLDGIMKGIGIDNKYNVAELEELKQWCSSHDRFRRQLPFSELLPVLDRALMDDVLTEDEIHDIVWLCDKYRNDTTYYDMLTADIQHLHGIMHGILADSEITEEEITGLRDWLVENEHLTGRYPYDELSTLIMGILKDGIVTDDEVLSLKGFFAEFIRPDEAFTIDLDELQRLKDTYTLKGICATCPTIEFESKSFCFTGASTKTTREGFENIVAALGGSFKRVCQSRLITWSSGMKAIPAGHTAATEERWKLLWS